VEFVPLGDEFRQASDGLYTAMGDLMDEMEGLNGLLRSANHTLTEDLRAVSHQCDRVFDVLLSAVDDFRDDVEEGLDGMVKDTSEEDIAATREGKIADCRSSGAIEGDRNVGGIAGAVAIELDLDPEDDGAERFSFGSTYETKAVLQNCVNTGAVAAKKDCAGGVAGRMDLGTALTCENYGRVESTGGDYTGGIAGYADASLRSSYAKNALAGKSYVGGIAGWASRMTDCCAIVRIEEGDECVGAIAGGVDTDGTLRGNRFLDTGTAGLDGVSYAGRAEPIDFAALVELPDVPAEFLTFTLTLRAGEETVAELPFRYGQDLSRLTLPPVPESEEGYGAWPSFDVSGTQSDIVLEAVYTPWVTVAASAELSDRRSLALADGQFTEAVVLHVTESGQTPPPGCGEDCVIWDVSLSESGLTDDAAVPLRLLSPGGGDAKVWQYRDGGWQSVEAVRNGQYLLVTMEGTSGTFCIQKASMVPVAAIAGVGVGGLAAAVAVLAVKRRKKKRKTVAAKTHQH